MGLRERRESHKTSFFFVLLLAETFSGEQVSHAEAINCISREHKAIAIRKLWQEQHR